MIYSTGITDNREKPFNYDCRGFGDLWTASLLIEGKLQKRYATGEQFRCRAPSLSIYHPFSRHQFRGVPPEHRIYSVWLIFKPGRLGLSRLHLPCEAEGGWCLDLGNAPIRDEVIRLFLEMERLWRQNRPYSRELAENALERAFLLLAAERAPGGEWIDPRIDTAIEYIHEHLTEKLSVAVLARVVNLSPSRFAHLFAEMTGRTPVEYIERVRLDEARNLLLSDCASIGEIAARVGYENQFYFSTRFKKSFGVRPLAFRKHPLPLA